MCGWSWGIDTVRLCRGLCWLRRARVVVPLPLTDEVADDEVMEVDVG